MTSLSWVIFFTGGNVPVSEIVTVSRQHPNFRGYLLGTFSTQFRAIPTRCFGTGGAQKFTFRIVPLRSIQQPAWILRWMAAVRPGSLVLTLGPLISVMTFFLTQKIHILWGAAVSATLAVLALQVAAHLYNDYFDHSRGIDRVDNRSGSRCIQLGWLTALAVKRAANGFLMLGVVLGAPLLWMRPGLLIWVALIGFLGALEFSSDRVGLKYRGLGELTMFVLLGPALLVGFTWAVGASVDIVILPLSVVFGLSALLYQHLKNMETIMLDSRAHCWTLAARLGFDRAKAVVGILMLCLLVALTVVGWVSGIIWAIVGTQFLIFIYLWHVWQNVLHTRIFISSNFINIRRKGIILHYLLAALLTSTFLIGA